MRRVIWIFTTFGVNAMVQSDAISLELDIDVQLAELSE